MVLSMEVSLALIAFAAPVTAAIMKLKPRKPNFAPDKFVGTREFDTFKADMGDRLTRIESGIDSLHRLLKNNNKF